MQKIEILLVVVVFIESKHILPEDMRNAVEDYFFARLPIAKEEKDVKEKIISSIYKDNIQIRKERDLSAFHKVDPSFLWFFNITSYCTQLALACFADDSIYGNLISKMFCYNNYLYSLYKSVNAKKDSGMPKWKLHDVIMRHLLHYLETNKRYKRQENIKIAKKIDIHTARFAL